MSQTAISKVCVIGLGYIGLPTAAMFASRKIKVVGVDVNQNVVDTINKGEIHIVEPELDMIVHAAVNEGYLKATDKPEEADAFLIAVPTPFKNDHEPDLSFIEAAAQSIAPVLRKGNLVILESTSPVGTTEQLANWLSDLRPDLNFPVNGKEQIDVCIAYCPERVLPGRVVSELVDNDRIIGGLTKNCSSRAIEIYRVFVKGEMHISNARTAEMCKLTENSFRDLNIAFANELSVICDELNINVWELIRLSNRHPRVSILEPGPGVGGHCIAVDPWFIVSSSPEHSELIRTARKVNNAKPLWVYQKTQHAIDSLVELNAVPADEIKIACLGLTFKANIDDVRESPALAITKALAEKYPGNVSCVEPNISMVPESLRNYGVRQFELGEALRTHQVIVLLVDHKEFKQIKPKISSNQRLVDTRGIWT